jgi:hypothetical protein
MAGNASGAAHLTALDQIGASDNKEITQWDMALGIYYLMKI